MKLRPRIHSTTAVGRRLAAHTPTDEASATTMNELRSAIIALSVRCSAGYRSCGSQWEVAILHDESRGCTPNSLKVLAAVRPTTLALSTVAFNQKGLADDR